MRIKVSQNARSCSNCGGRMVYEPADGAINKAGYECESCHNFEEGTDGGATRVNQPTELPIDLASGKSKVKTAQGQVSIDHEPFSPQGEGFEDDTPRAEEITPFVPDKKDKALTGEYQDTHPYRRILIEQIKQDLDGYDALAKMGVVANGKLTNKLWPTNGHGFAGWSKPEVLDLLVWLTEGGIEQSFGALYDQYKAKEYADKALKMRGLSAKKNKPTPVAQVAIDRHIDSSMSYMEKALAAAREMLQEQKTKGTIPLPTEPPTGDSSRAAKSLWALKKIAQVQLKVPFFNSQRDAEEVAKLTNQGWGHRSNGQPHVFVERRDNGFIIRPNWNYFTGEQSSAWKNAVQDALALDATLIEYSSLAPTEQPRQAKSLWQMQRFAQAVHGSQRRHIPISEGFRICRGCGATVPNEFDFQSQGLMCDKCSKESYKDKSKTAQQKFRKPSALAIPDWAKEPGVMWDDPRLVHMGINERIPIHAYLAEKYAKEGDRFLANHHAKSVLSLSAAGLQGTPDFMKALHVLVDLGEQISDDYKPFLDNENQKTAQVIPGDGFADGGAAYTDEEMDLMEGKTQSKKADEPRRWAIKVSFDDGDSLETWINGTQDEIRKHYLNNDFVLADEKTMHRPIKVEFIEDLGEVPWTYWGEAKRPKADKEAKSLWELKKVSQFYPSERDRPNRTQEMPKSKPLELPEGATYIDSGYWRLPAGVAKRLCGGTLPRAGYERIVEFGGSKWAIHQTPVRGEMVWGLRWIKNLDSTETSNKGA